MLSRNFRGRQKEAEEVLDIPDSNHLDRRILLGEELIEVGLGHFPEGMTENQKEKSLLYLISEFSKKDQRSYSPFFKKIIEEIRTTLTDGEEK